MLREGSDIEEAGGGLESLTILHFRKCGKEMIRKNQKSKQKIRYSEARNFCAQNITIIQSALQSYRAWRKKIGWKNSNRNAHRQHRYFSKKILDNPYIIIEPLILMKQLTASQPLAYRLQNAELITALPYIDEEIPDLRSKVQYLIKTEEGNMTFNKEEYLKDIQMPITPFADSEHFEKEVERIMGKLGQPKQSTKNKKGEKKIFDIPPVKLAKIDAQTQESLNKISVKHHNNLVKQVNLELYQKFGPLILKQQMASLDKRKQLLQQQIEEEKKLIQQLNQQRRYNQLEAQDREQTVHNRTQVMIHKKRRVD